MDRLSGEAANQQTQADFKLLSEINLMRMPLSEDNTSLKHKAWLERVAIVEIFFSNTSFEDLPDESSALGKSIREKYLEKKLQAIGRGHLEQEMTEAELEAVKKYEL